MPWRRGWATVPLVSCSNCIREGLVIKKRSLAVRGTNLQQRAVTFRNLFVRLLHTIRDAVLCECKCQMSLLPAVLGKTLHIRSDGVHLNQSETMKRISVTESLLGVL